MLSGILKKCPIPVLGVLKSVFKSNDDLSELINNIRLEAYIEKTEFESVDVSKRSVCKIQEGEWEYPLFNVCFLENVFKNIVYCLVNGYRPVVVFQQPDNYANLWEQLLVQPYGGMTGSEEHYLICDTKSAPIYFPLFPTSADVRKYGKLYQAFFKPNAEFQAYREDEYEQILQGKRVLGVLCRGTDYVVTKPKGHPIQPKVEDVIELAEKKMEELKCTHIYLATEERSIQQQFEKSFPGKILTNKRQYFDSYYQISDKNALISKVSFGRENDNYYKALEYFSSIYLLSCCNALIAGCCGGSRAALYMNYEKYEYSYLFNLGVY